MDVYLESLGCARNQVDSDVMLARLAAAGWRRTEDPAAADAIVVNTCSFIESAADESIDTILALSEYKRTGRCRRLIVVGCLPERYREETASALPEVDLFLGTGAYDRIVDAIGGGLAAGACLLPDPDAIQVEQEGRTSVARLSSTTPWAYLKIAEGCSRHCTYCIIPKLRGRQKSRTPGSILEEADILAASGAGELVLVAQETTAYGRDLNPPADFAALLEDLALRHPEVWTRFLYGHPESISPAVIAAVARHANLCPYFDIPIQHASAGILRRMGRHHAPEDLLRLFDAIRAAVPHAALRTTVLVGFPGETDRDFRQLVDFVERVRFDHLGAFAYSDAEDLPSHRLDRHVGRQTAQDRLDELMAVQMEISAENLSRLKGSTLHARVQEGPRDGYWVARSQVQAPEVDGTILIRMRENELIQVGRKVKVRIIDTLDYDVIAELV